MGKASGKSARFTGNKKRVIKNTNTLSYWKT